MSVTLRRIIARLRALEDAPGGGGGSAWADITGLPAAFPPEAHSHAISDTTGLQSALDGKQAAGSYAAATHTHTASAISDSTMAGRALLTAADAAAQRTALGLGTAATSASTAFAAAAIETEVTTARGNAASLGARIAVISNFASPNAGGLISG